MAEDPFLSSDSNRHSRPLKYVQTVTFDEPFPLELGHTLPGVTVAYETYGELNATRDNAVLICHALSGDSHVAKHNEADDPGWWDLVVGPGKPIDTERFFVICPNILGGCRGTTGPNTIQPGTGKPFGLDFPAITVRDMVDVQRKVIDWLGIERLRAVIGGSLGGHMTLTWAIRYPDRLAGAIAIASSARLTSQALAFDVVGRNAIMRDPGFRAGQYYHAGPGPTVGLALARMLGHITYLSNEAMTQKFDADRLGPRNIHTGFETKFSVGSYLAYQGDRFVERFDANSYLTLSMAMDLFDLGKTPEQLAQALGQSTCRWLLISFTSDWLFPAFQSREVVHTLISAGKPVSYCNIQSNCGHDAFLLSDELELYGEMIRSFLLNLNLHDGARIDQPAWYPSEDLDLSEHDLDRPTSIFHLQRRLDYDSIVELIPADASVLDLGCGNGGLLAQLRARGHRRIMGIEIDEQAILVCIRRGLDVIQADLNEGLPAFADQQFDFIVLSQTLQTVMDVEHLLNEMLRVGRRGVISFPNLGYYKWRMQLANEGRAPQMDAIDGFQWYNTPNVRFLTIADFEAFCLEKGIHIHQRVSLNTERDEHVGMDANLQADIAIVVFSR